MKDNVVYFAHGKESGPWGTKIKVLAKVAKDFGCYVESPDYTFTMNPEERVSHLLSLAPKAKKNLILVGSSMGGYVSAVASGKLKPRGLFLLAPAFYRKGYRLKVPVPRADETWIVHGFEDDVIPFMDSVRYANRYHAELYLMPGDHRLTAQLPKIKKLFALFLGICLKRKSKS